MQEQKQSAITSSPTKSKTPFLQEVLSLSRIAFPIILTALLLYSRSIISMLFLAHLGDLSLAAGSLALGFANITGYYILSGLAVGMEPICSQAFRAERYTLLGLSLQSMVLLLVLASLPISILWCYMERILLFCGQDPAIAGLAQSFLIYSLPDLFAQSVLHPLRIYLRSQSITFPLTCCSAVSMMLHVAINYLLVVKLGMGIKGVAMSSVWANVNVVVLLVLFIVFSGVYKKTWGGFSTDCFRGWKLLLNLAVPSCVSVCLEWWWYEIMIIHCRLLMNPKSTVAAMGILIQTTSLIYIFPSSHSFSVSTCVGNEIGASRPDRARFAAIVSISGSFLLGITAQIFAVWVRNISTWMFTQEKEIITLTAMVLPIIGLCELANCPQTTGCGVLRGTARPKVDANMNLGCFYLVGMPVAVGLAFYYKMDFGGLWLGMLAAQASFMATMLVVLLRTDWKYEARGTEDLTGTGQAYEIIDV